MKFNRGNILTKTEQKKVDKLHEESERLYKELTKLTNGRPCSMYHRFSGVHVPHPITNRLREIEIELEEITGIEIIY